MEVAKCAAKNGQKARGSTERAIDGAKREDKLSDGCQFKM
jgi:hypothetical protein